MNNKLMEGRGIPNKTDKGHVKEYSPINRNKSKICLIYCCIEYRYSYFYLSIAIFFHHKCYNK